MKTPNFQKSFLAVVAATSVAFSAMSGAAQNSPASSVPPLAYGVPQILQLVQAKVSDDTIVAYIRNSGNSYGLNADQIIYLRQQGVSDHVIAAMLNQPKAAAAPAQAMTQPDNSSSTEQNSVAYVQPATSYVQSAPPATVYVVPNTQTYYYNSYCAQPYFYPCYVNPFPVVSFSFGFGGRFGGGFRGGGGFHGGFHR